MCLQRITGECHGMYLFVYGVLSPMFRGPWERPHSVLRIHCLNAYGI